MSNLWQECRAYIATVLFGWAQRAHMGATMDMAKGLAAMEAEATDAAVARAEAEARALIARIRNGTATEAERQRLEAARQEVRRRGRSDDRI